MAPAYNADEIVSKCVAKHGDTEDSTECAVRSLARVSEQQMSIAQYLYIASVIEGPRCRSSCALLIFGVGGDSPIWLHANRRGKTVFIEESREYAELARERSPAIDVRVVDYVTRYEKIHQQADDIDERLWDFLPEDVANGAWDVVLIDAPTAYQHGTYGRLQPVWWTSRNAALNHERHMDIFLHDHNREGERFIGKEFFTFPFATQPLIITSPIRDQHLAHWRLGFASQNSIARKLARASNNVSGQQLPVLQIYTQPNDDESSHCFNQLCDTTFGSVRENTNIDDSAVVRFQYSSTEDGILSVPFGEFGTAHFRAASRLKSLAVRAAARLGFGVLLADTDIYFEKDLPWAHFQSIFQRLPHVHIIAQQDLANKCSFGPNSGFYVTRPSSWLARFLSRVIVVTQRSGHTEQQAWMSLLDQDYKSIIYDLCVDKNIPSFEFIPSDTDVNLPIALLPLEKYINGYWLNKSSLALESEQHNDWPEPYIAHFNFVIGVCNKLKMAQSYAVLKEQRKRKFT